MPATRRPQSCLRILTPLLKFRACRDNIPVATGAMEVRGGNGYIEEWVNARLVRDAHIGVLWEGTSNINALDIITRAVGKSRAHRALASRADAIAGRGDARFPPRSATACARRSTARLAFAERVAAEPALEAKRGRRRAALYHITSAVLMTWEAARPGADARRALYARLVLEHRWARRIRWRRAAAWEREAAECCCRNERYAGEIAGFAELGSSFAASRRRQCC